MAQQATRKQAEAVPISTRSPRLPKGKKDAPPDYSKWRHTFTDPDAFMNFMRGYPNTTGLTLFLYRLVPKIDLSLIGVEGSNIQKGGFEDLALFAYEAVAEKFGRGKYQIRVTDSNRPDGQREVVKSCQYKIEDAEKPPVYDVRTLVMGHADSMDEVNRLLANGTLVRDNSGAPRLRTAADAAPVVAAPVASGGLPITSDLFGQLLLAAFQKQQTPHDVVKDTLDLAKLIAPPPGPVPSVDQVADAVVARLGNGRGAAADPFSAWERVQSFVDKVKGPGPSAAVAVAGELAAGDAGASWAPHIANILAQARALVPEVVGAFREMRAMNGNGQAGAPPAQQQQNPGVQAMPPLAPIEQRIEEVFRLGFQKMQEGVTGFDFAAFVCYHMRGGLEVYQTLEPSGAAGLIALAAMNPAARPVVNDPKVRPQLEAFLTDFFSFDPTGGASDEEPGAAAAASAS